MKKAKKSYLSQTYMPELIKNIGDMMLMTMCIVCLYKKLRNK